METAQLLRQSLRVEAKKQAKVLERPNESTVSRRSKRLAIRNGPVPEEQVEPPIEELVDFIAALPKELFDIIMNMLELWQQFTLRRVCHSWKAKIERMLNRVPKECLKLNVKRSPMVEQAESRCVRTWDPKESIRRMQFEFAYKEPVIASSAIAQITIWDSAFNSEAALAIGRIFSRIKTLIIYWKAEDSEQKVDNLVLLLSQFTEFNVLTTLGLIFPSSLTKRETLPKICTAINTHIGQLNQLHLMVPDEIITNNPQPGERPTFEAYPPIELDKAILFATNFSITGSVPNISSHLNRLCYGQKLLRSSSSLVPVVHPQLESLSFSFNIDQDLQNDLVAALDSNKDEFVSVKRLQLVNIRALEAVSKVLKYFPNVEQLFLRFSIDSAETFGLKWIRALKPLLKLVELTLLNYIFERKSLRYALHTFPVDETVNLSQVRKLTIATHCLFLYLRRDSNPIGGGLLPRLKSVDISGTINMRFPGLQELNMWSGDCELHETPQSSWRSLEQSLNRELPLRLPLLPGLRVNIQMRHPAMYSVDIKTRCMSAIEASDARQKDARFAVSNEIIERRVPPYILLHRGIENGLLVAKFYCNTMRGNITILEAQAQDPPEEHGQVPTNGQRVVIGDLVQDERFLRGFIQVLLNQSRNLPDRQEQVTKAIKKIRELMQLRRELIVPAALLAEQAQPNLPNQPERLRYVIRLKRSKNT